MTYRTFGRDPPSLDVHNCRSPTSEGFERTACTTNLIILGRTDHILHHHALT